MSIDIQWEKLTQGEKGINLAESIRSFVHDRFQQVSLPRFIRSVNVHSFSFGDQAPVIEVKDICDPNPEFYADESEDNEKNGSEEEEDEKRKENASSSHQQQKTFAQPHNEKLFTLEPKNNYSVPMSPLLMHATQGLPGSSSNLNYFHLPYTPGLPGSATPLAAVASGKFNWLDNSVLTPGVGGPATNQNRHSHLHSHSHSVSSLANSTSDPASRPTSQHFKDEATKDFAESLELNHDFAEHDEEAAPPRDANDLQIVSHVKYSGNMGLILTADILLDYPMSSFVGIPFKLLITGFKFDGVAITAFAQKKLHFCFLSPEDASAFLGADSTTTSGHLLEEIRVESEIGQQEDGKQVLKNVGKVEKFILDQVRQIFENEFVFPSHWTFLV